ncbi:preprotein translocase subunit YajC [Lactobacillus colini]|uniref:Preprotein translocase subunit YajC n=1 Tax=Lactobacillus colini TaxID=1819254 RepID=A0ABS4MGW4_9LACO|nr:preprotein translocase subunit YajC [Lactobacillus colini]MBP2058564.1 preprotein translocase subunit YajC [Lactobacillus colini]
MNTFILAQTAAGGNSMFMIVIFIVLIAFMYFTMIRPQKKQQQKRMEMMNELKAGDHVVLIDGLHGKIDSINKEDNTVVVDANGIFLTFSRMAVRQVVPAKDNEGENKNKEDQASPKADLADTNKSNDVSDVADKDAKETSTEDNSEN